MATASAEAIRQCRHLLNQLFNGEDPDRFVLTLNCTDSLNIALKGTLEQGDHVITSDLEHNSVSRPLVGMHQAGYIELSRIQGDSQGNLDPEQIRKAITPKTKMVVLTHASNVLGTVQPIDEIGRICRGANLLFLVDAAQTAGVLPIDVRASHIDLLAFPGHKALYGPSGTGALYVGPRAHVKPWREGGTGGDSKHPVQPAELPYSLEGGTCNTLGAVGMAEGIHFVQQVGMNKIHDHEMNLLKSLAEQMTEQGLFSIEGHTDWNRHVPTLSFKPTEKVDMHVSDIAASLDASFDIAIRPGLHCAPYIHKAQGSYPDGTVRVSPGYFNTQDHIDQFVKAIKEVVTF